MENEIGVNCSDARAIQPILTEEQGVDTATECSDGKLCSDSWAQEGCGGMFKSLLGEVAASTWGRCCQRKSSSGPRANLASRLWNLDSLPLFH